MMQDLWAGFSWGFLSNGVTAEWAGAAAEILVAVVIYLELKAGRFAVLESKALDPKPRKQRERIYDAFFGCGTGSESLDWLREEFKKKLDDDSKLRAMCENQIVLFNHLWFLMRWSPLRRRQVSKWFQHVVVPFWIMVGPFILEKGWHKGGWTEGDLLDFTLASIRFMERRRLIGAYRWMRNVPFIRQYPKLVMWGGEKGEHREVSDEFLAKIRSEIEAERMKRWGVRLGASASLDNA
jgi:hypothetical protein